MAFGKSEFKSIEALEVRFEPFIDPTSGGFITAGDTCELTIVRPDGSTLPGGPHMATRNADTGIWAFTIVVGSYVQGNWLVKGHSDHASAPRDQVASYFWGFGIAEDLLTLKRLIANRRKVDRNTNKVTVYGDNDSSTAIFEGTLKDSLNVASVGKLKSDDVHEQTELLPVP